MRVFKFYTFDLKERVLFKDTMSYVENWLKEKGIDYSGIGLALCWYSEKFYQKYPSMLKYKSKSYLYGNAVCSRDWITSVRDEWPDNTDIHVEADDEDVVREIVSKIPRPFNFGGTKVILDNIRWFDEINTAPVIRTYISKEPENIPCYYPGTLSFASNHLTNSIHLTKGEGKKHNMVEAYIEVTKNHDELMPYEPIVEALTGLLGKPYTEENIIVFDNVKAAQYEAARLQIQQQIQDLGSMLCLPIYDSGLKRDLSNLYEVIENEMRLGGIAPKKALLPLCKEYGYKYKTVPYNGIYECVKKNANNHWFMIECVQLPVKRVYECELKMKGYNFNQSMFLGSFMPEDQEEMESRLRGVFELAADIEPNLSQLLLKHYDRSPVWYEV